MASEVEERTTDEVFAVIQSLLSSTEINSQRHKVLIVLQSFFRQTLDESFTKLESETKLRQACENQLLGLSTKVNDLKREYSHTLNLREEEISNYERENRKLLESNKRRADNLNKVRIGWTKLSAVPELLQKRKSDLMNLERECFLKHVSCSENEKEVIKNFGDGFSKKSMEFCGKEPLERDKVPLEQLRTEVAKTWVLINKQERVLEKLLDQFYAQLERSNNQSLLHDCNGNMVNCGAPQLPLVIPPKNRRDKVSPLETVQNKSYDKIIDRNTTLSLLDALISIGSLCKNGPSAVQTSQEDDSEKKNPPKLCVTEEQPPVSDMTALEERIKKYEDMVRNFDRAKVLALQDKLAEKIAKLEMQASTKLNV